MATAETTPDVHLRQKKTEATEDIFFCVSQKAASQRAPPAPPRVPATDASRLEDGGREKKRRGGEKGTLKICKSDCLGEQH